MEPQAGYSEIADVVRDQNELVVERDSRNHRVGERSRAPLARLLVLEPPSAGRNVPGDRVVVQAFQQGICGRRLLRPHSRVNFGDVDRAASECVVRAQQLLEQCSSRRDSAQNIDDNRGVEEIGGHACAEGSAAAVRFSPDTADEPRSAAREFRMVF